tara:strand:+ start:275 stop:919 length:645 start_codon:yes stop_codon:yes gene_type:complete
MAKAKFSTTPEALSAILNAAIPLFSLSGFSGVSMRHVASAVGVSIATIYHHFPDKETLYLRCIEEAFASKALGLAEVLPNESTVLDAAEDKNAVQYTKAEQLERFIYRFTCLMSEDSHFRRLFQRELLDADEARLRILARDVFQNQFKDMLALAKKLAPESDPHLTVISMVGLILFHLETTPLRSLMPGGLPEHNDPEVISKHVTHLLLNGVIA